LQETKGKSAALTPMDDRGSCRRACMHRRTYDAHVAIAAHFSSLRITHRQPSSYITAVLQRLTPPRTHAVSVDLKA